MLWGVVKRGVPSKGEGGGRRNAGLNQGKKK